MINFATIGTSWITSSFITSAQSTQKWRLNAVYSRAPDSASAFASKHQISKTHISLDQLAADSDIQAVYIASPNSLHYEQAKLLLQAGKHVILEKPACSTSAELDELFRIAEAKKVFLIEAFRHIHEANFKVLKSNLGKLGTIYGASLTYSSFSSRYGNVLAGETPNIFSLDYSGGAIVDIGVYPISAAIALFGAPEGQMYKPFVVATGVDGGGVAVLRYETFGVAINASKIFTSTAPTEVYGEKGTRRCNGVTDITSVEFVDAKTKKSEQLAGEAAELNMSEEAEEYARIIESGDWEAAKTQKKISRATQVVTEAMRKENGIVFAAEKRT